MEEGPGGACRERSVLLLLHLEALPQGFPDPDGPSLGFPYGGGAGLTVVSSHAVSLSHPGWQESLPLSLTQIVEHTTCRHHGRDVVLGQVQTGEEALKVGFQSPPP